MSIADELARLEELRRIGSLTEIEFEEAKRQVLAGQAGTGSGPVQSAMGASGLASDIHSSDIPRSDIHGVDEKLWCTLMHLSQLLTISGLGIVVPIVMWITSKDESEEARRHGARMMNWFLTSIIFACVGFLLTIFLVGIPLLMLLALLELIFPIIAAIKANGGEAWSYPFAIRFIPED